MHHQARQWLLEALSTPRAHSPWLMWSRRIPRTGDPPRFAYLSRRVTLRNQATEILVALTSGLVLSFAYPGWDLSLLAWVALAPFFLLMLRPRSAWGYARLSLAFGFAFFGGLNHWLLAMHPLTWVGGGMTPGISLAVVLVAWIALALVLAMGLTTVFTVVGLTWRTLERQGRLGPWAVISLSAGGWIALEMAQAMGSFGYPWGVLALTQYQTLPILQAVAWVGPFPLSGLVVAVNVAIAWLVLSRSWKLLAGSLTVVGLTALAGIWWMSQPAPGEAVRVAAIQGNVSQAEKWQAGSEADIQQRYFELSNRVPAARLVAWPETAVPVFLAQQLALVQRFETEARARRQYLLTGAFHQDQSLTGQTCYYNGITVFDPNGANLGWDAKKHLVPFGEYLPGRDVLPPIWAQLFSRLNLLATDLSPGDRPRPFDTEFGLVGANVCFDSIFPSVMRETTRSGASVLVLVTNDGWYKRTMALRQHLAHGILRAVENRRPFLQAANTGVSGIVDHNGRILAVAPAWEQAVAEASIIPQTGLTPYTRYGDWLSWFVVGAALMLTAWTFTARTS